MATLNRSELLFVYDTQDCNPNENLIGDSRPCRDPDARRGVITSVRLKRYLRDQLQDDDFDIYVKKTEGRSRTRTKLVKDVLGNVDDTDDLEDFGDVVETFLDVVVDARYFGLALSSETSDKDEDEALRDVLNSSLSDDYQGPVQSLPSKLPNEVEKSEGYGSLTSVISTGEGNRQGRLDLDDRRIKHGIFPFWGLVDSNGMGPTNLLQADVEWFSTPCWCALKN